MIGEGSMKLHYQKKKKIYSHLNLEVITDEDYTHSKRIREDFETKNSEKCHNLYVRSNTLLLADVF